MAIKIKSIKFANAVMLNNVANGYYDERTAEIWLEGIIVKLIHINTKDVSYTSLMNCIEWKEAKEEAPKSTKK